MWRSLADFIAKGQAARHFLTAHGLNKALAIFDIAHRSLIYVGYFSRAEKKFIPQRTCMYISCNLAHFLLVWHAYKVHGHNTPENG